MFIWLPGRSKKSLEASLSALELDPLDLIINVHLAWHHWLAREPDEALQQAEKARELDPHVIWSGFFAGLALEEQGLYQQATTEFKNALDMSENFSLLQAALGHALARNGQVIEARKILEALERQRSREFVPAYDIAIAHIGLDDKDSALVWLRELVNERSGWASYIMVKPRLDAVRFAPPFKALIQKSVR